MSTQWNTALRRASLLLALAGVVVVGMGCGSGPPDDIDRVNTTFVLTVTVYGHDQQPVAGEPVTFVARTINSSGFPTSSTTFTQAVGTNASGRATYSAGFMVSRNETIEVRYSVAEGASGRMLWPWSACWGAAQFGSATVAADRNLYY